MARACGLDRPRRQGGGSNRLTGSASSSFGAAATGQTGSGRAGGDGRVFIEAGEYESNPFVVPVPDDDIAHGRNKMIINLRSLQPGRYKIAPYHAGGPCCLNTSTMTAGIRTTSRASPNGNRRRHCGDVSRSGVDRNGWGTALACPDIHGAAVPVTVRRYSPSRRRRSRETRKPSPLPKSGGSGAPVKIPGRDDVTPPER